MVCCCLSRDTHTETRDDTHPGLACGVQGLVVYFPTFEKKRRSCWRDPTRSLCYAPSWRGALCRSYIVTVWLPTSLCRTPVAPRSVRLTLTCAPSSCPAGVVMTMAMRVLRRTAPANLPRLAVAARHLRTSAPAGLHPASAGPATRDAAALAVSACHPFVWPFHMLLAGGGMEGRTPGRRAKGAARPEHFPLFPIPPAHGLRAPRPA